MRRFVLFGEPTRHPSEPSRSGGLRFSDREATRRLRFFDLSSSPPSVAAISCQAGKDVYVEKPVSHNVVEGRRMVEAARKYNRIV